jgi:hypothetical protein
MTNAADLRKGNLLKRIHPHTSLPDVIVEVLTTDSDRIAFMYPNLEHRVEPFEDDVAEIGEGFIPLSELEPIALNEAWLTRAGFEINGNIAQLKSVQNLAFTWDGHGLLPAAQPGNNKALLYLHELQNAYEDKTGSTLDIEIGD